MFEEERRHLADGTEDESTIRNIVLGVATEAGLPIHECLYIKTIPLMDRIEELCLAKS